jgi:hemerythrin-like domain-containing protein
MAKAEAPPGTMRSAASVAALCSAPDPIGIVAEEHALQRELCDVLEALADDLPKPPDPALVLISLDLLEQSLPSHIRFEEDAFFPLLRARLSQTDVLLHVLNCLGDEHDRELGAIAEVADALRSVLESGVSGRAEMLGYLLRGFFEGQRRHMAWEDKVVLPVARVVLSTDDLAWLQGWIMTSDRPRCTRKSLMEIRRARSASEVCDTCASSRTTTPRLIIPPRIARDA